MISFPKANTVITPGCHFFPDAILHPIWHHLIVGVPRQLPKLAVCDRVHTRRKREMAAPHVVPAGVNSAILWPGRDEGIVEPDPQRALWLQRPVEIGFAEDRAEDEGKKGEHYLPAGKPAHNVHPHLSELEELQLVSGVCYGILLQ